MVYLFFVIIVAIIFIIFDWDNWIMCGHEKSTGFRHYGCAIGVALTWPVSIPMGLVLRDEWMKAEERNRRIREGIE